MGVFDGIDPDREAAIRQALTRELRHQVAEELRGTIRRQVGDEVRAEVMREVAERAPTEAEREAFREYVREVRLDAYAQAEVASEIAERSQAAFEKNRNVGTVVTLAVAALMLVILTGAAFGFVALTPAFIAAVVAMLVLLLAGAVVASRRVSELARRGREHAKISGDFLVVAERAKAYAMVHADRIASADELHELLEELRRDKEKQDRQFDPGVRALEYSRAAVQLRIEDQHRTRIGVASYREGAVEHDDAVRDRARK